MKILYDSSAIIALIVKEHPKYDQAVQTYMKLSKKKNSFYICTHTIAEVFRSITRGADYLITTAGEANQIINEVILPVFDTVDLTTSDYVHVLSVMEKNQLTGAIIYDALISQSAAKINADYLVTFNAKDFQRVFPENGADLIIPG